MDVLILHDEVAADARPDELDTLVQARAVAAACEALGHRPRLGTVGLDLAALAADLERVRPDVVFQLVESVARSGRLAHLPAHVLEHLGVPFTGGSAQTLFLTNSKLLTKVLLAQRGLPTPAWLSAEDLACDRAIEAGPWLLKAVWEHGSLGIEADGVVSASATTALREALARRAASFGGEGFAERYVHGREFNLALLEVDGGAQCLPVAEMRFERPDDGAPRVVGYKAKWDPASPDYWDTVRCFDFGPSDRELVERLRLQALGAWEALGLAGYARVDFRVGADNASWIIDVNVNPCITPDAGFAATLTRAGISYEAAVAHILQAALRRAIVVAR